MKSYLQYMQEVLGVNGVMMPVPLQTPSEAADGLEKPAFFYTRQGALEPAAAFTQAKFVIVNWVHQGDESLFATETADLFEKMFSAMKLPAEEVLILDCPMNDRNLIPNELYKRVSPQLVLFFSSEPVQMGEFQIKGPARWLETLSPAFLRKNPGSKKIVWKDLQKIMAALT